MAMHFGHALVLLVFLVVHASSCEQEDYWKMKLPNVPMPPAIKDNLFHSHDIESTIDTKEKKFSLNQPYTVFSWHYDTDNAKEKARGKDIEPSTIDTKEKKASLNQPYTVFSWNYDANNAKEKAKGKDIKPSTIDTKEKEASLSQPYTVFSWNYDADNAKEKTIRVKDVKPTTIDTKKKAGLNQPYTVVAWHYDAETKEKAKVEDVGSSRIDTKEKKASLNQPYTVFSWHYDADTKEKAKLEDIELSTIDTKVKKVSLNQPYTVFSWLYDADNAKEKTKVRDIKPSTIDTKENKISLNQPYTVFSWLYNVDNAKGKTKVTDIDPSTINIKEKRVSLNQPYTVFSWHYHHNAKEKTKVTEFKPSTNDKEEKKVSLNQPYTVFSWNYDADNFKEETKVKDLKPSSIDIMEKKGGIDQPYTVFSWNYKANKTEENVKEEDSKDNSHHHYHHSMHKTVNSDDTQQDLSAGSVFFVEKSLRLGMTLKHDFQKTPKIPFLPQHIAQSIPFSVDRIAEIINLFSIKSSSADATTIKETLGVCLQRPKVKKENRTCAQSMEDIVDFVVGELGTNNVELRMMRNDIEVVNGIKDYVITKVKKLVVPGNNAVACHRMSYPYVVYYCHHQQDIGHYDVTLVNPTSGTAIQTTAVCHYDTYAWQPDVPALQYLGIRPGDAPVCHFSAINDMFWTIKDNSDSLDMAQ